MEQIFVGILRSHHDTKFKKAFVDKLIQSNKLINPGASDKLNLNSIITEIEKIWLGDELLLPDLNLKQKNDQIKSKYESLKLHSDLIKQILNYFNLNFDQIQFDLHELETHLDNLFKSVFLTNLNRSNLNILIVKNTVILLITWLHLLIDSFSNQIELRFSLIQILSLINFKFSPRTTDITNFYYFIQNDYKFCGEYLNLIRSFNFNVLLSYYQTNRSNLSTIENCKKYDYVESIMFETICLFLNSITYQQNLPDQEQQLLLNNCEIYKQESNVLIKEFLNNLSQIVDLIRSFVTKSSKLFEWSLKYLIDILSDHTFGPSASTNSSNENSNTNQPKVNTLNPFTAELFKCFDINQAQVTINNYFNEASITSTSIDDTILRNLLLSLIFLLSWPLPHNIDEWVCSLMTLIAIKLQKFKLLVNICKDALEYVISHLTNRSTRTSSLNVLCFFIINYQHSPSLFHKACPKIAQLLQDLKPKEQEPDQNSNTENKSESESYEKLKLLSFICISKFGGYPELYKPILDVIQNELDLTHLEAFKAKYLINPGNSTNFISQNETNKSQSNNEIIIEDDVNAEINESKCRPNVTGLINLGNTCYLNCIMQSLFACKKFVKNILDIDTSQINLSEDSFLTQIQILFAIMHMTNRPAIKASNFVKYCTPSWFKFGHQQDSSEFLIFLLDNLNEQLKQLYKCNETHTTLIQNTFGMHLLNECECSNCHTKTTRTDINFYLPLSFSNEADASKKQSLQHLIDNFFRPEKLSIENGNPYSCSKCQSLQTASKNIYLTQSQLNQAPDYLIFTLNRFIYKKNNDGLQNVKLMDQLEYPTQISINTLGDNDKLITEYYKIVAIVVHSGSSLHYGHYYSYIINDSCDEENKIEWLLANDSQISHASFDGLISNLNLFKNDTPYVLFYKRVCEKSAPKNNDEIKISSKKLIDIIEQDNIVYELQEKSNLLKKKQNEKKNEFNSTHLNDKYTNYFRDDDDDPNNGPRSSGQPPNHCSNDSQRDSGPRIIF